MRRVFWNRKTRLVGKLGWGRMNPTVVNYPLIYDRNSFLVRGGGNQC